MNESRATIRVDKWLWYARFFKTRGLAAKLVSGGHLRVNSNRIAKAAHAIGAGDTLTFPQGNRIRVVTVLDLGTRRGPAPEAQALYDDLTPAPEPAPEARPARIERDSGGRPTKKERRALDGLRARDTPDDGR
ncbi:Ribosome-associated heat shock protein [Candidatus Rhodobacter oscarellae]|uniref:Ribosome-associated heat shock protein n=1 Tax=Candidatus Rhodobacter oscarellae TaxID=1675527 RepID=A0A0J9E5Q5_9RHOB|nr:RNA-binding S4 domain-containing protein [Candidatus Rhodobacter lobularis]KMW58067.1 Ribosome-associated heat shock protein [Candidatus Rhodobacter lobularis]